MTKYDIKLRRKSLTSGQIGRHKNFKGLYTSERPPKKFEGKNRIIAIVVALIVIIGMIVLGFNRVKNVQKSDRLEVPAKDIFDEFKKD